MDVMEETVKKRLTARMGEGNDASDGSREIYLHRGRILIPLTR
jgi:hypothetical protein